MAVIPEATITVDAEPLLYALVRELADEQRQCREYLGRLVALEEERRDVERQLAAALLPHEASSDVAVEESDLDWFRDSEGRYRVHEQIGNTRPATPAEARRIESIMRNARERRGKR